MAKRNIESPKYARQAAYKRRHPERVRLQQFKYRLRRLYGMEFDEYEQLRAGGCQICGAQEETMHVDHDHDRGTVRGLLCRCCNIGIGHFRDDPETLRAAIRYLEHRASE